LKTLTTTKQNGSNLETQRGITVFDKKKFVESVIARKLGLYAIVAEARADIRQTESRAIRARGSSDRIRFLRILVFFLISEVKSEPANLSDDDFKLLFQVTKYLVDRGDLEPNVLELFSAG
jgi:hypothetical protein